MSDRATAATCEPAGLSRRRLLGAAGCGRCARRRRRPGCRHRVDPARPSPDRRTAVTCSWCSACRGGFDGLSAIVPAADPAYAGARPGIGIPTSALLPLDATFGLHPALAPLKGLWDAGQLAAVHAAGQPDPTRSHFRAMEEMERAAPGSGVRTGWLDRVSSAEGAGIGVRDRRGRRRGQPAGAARRGTRAADGVAGRVRALRRRRRRGTCPLDRRARGDAPRRPRRGGGARAAHPRRPRYGGGAAGRGVRRGERCCLSRRRPRRRAARRGAAGEGAGGAPGRDRRLRRLGHARRPRPGRRRLDGSAAHRARRGARRVRDRPGRRRSAA